MAKLISIYLILIFAASFCVLLYINSDPLVLRGSSFSDQASIHSEPVRYTSLSVAATTAEPAEDTIVTLDTHFTESQPISFGDSRFHERRLLLNEECSKQYNGFETLKVSRDRLDHILVDEDRKILFCYVPKVACTNWKRIFLVLNGIAPNVTYAVNLPSYEVHNRTVLRSLQNYTVPEVSHFLKEYTKYIVVRHPFERLLSAYRNKFQQHYESAKYFQVRFGRFIVKNFRKNPSKQSLANGDDVTFLEFVTFLTQTNPNLYNEHWQTINYLCHPCFIQYQIVGKYETISEDARDILKMFGLNGTFPNNAKPSKTADSLQEYIKLLPENLLEKLFEMYEMDFKLFNYTYPILTS